MHSCFHHYSIIVCNILIIKYSYSDWILSGVIDKDSIAPPSYRKTILISSEVPEIVMSGVVLPC